ncbi:putative transmembrane protein [Rhizoctonia solani 123E]|uniref:Putative transmembrane protein n=1 Tax=Rhizoctonia solani 123E TaxID=1423351 RepID=A0A074RQL5_9AGAM|nr:putative transmembrane protein [Rhizoctonia solani 123E]
MVSRTKSERAFREGSQNALLTTAALIIAAIVQLKTQGLSLLDGLTVSMVSYMTAGWVLINQSHVEFGFSSDFLLFVFTTLATYWGFQIWLDPADFGIPLGRENCTASIDTIFVVLGQNIRVTNKVLRDFALSCFALNALHMLLSLMNCMRGLVHYTVNGTEKCTVSKVADSDVSSPASKGVSTDKLYKMRLAFPVLGLMIYIMFNIEQMVNRHQVQTQMNGWTYGQGLAIIGLVQQVVGSYSLIREEYHWAY